MGAPCPARDGFLPLRGQHDHRKLGEAGLHGPVGANGTTRFDLEFVDCAEPIRVYLTGIFLGGCYGIKRRLWQTDKLSRPSWFSRIPCARSQSANPEDVGPAMLKMSGASQRKTTHRGLRSDPRDGRLPNQRRLGALQIEADTGEPPAVPTRNPKF